jgi:GTPase SAR1 family protein
MADGTLKLVVVGESQVGKTWVSFLFFHPSFYPLHSTFLVRDVGVEEEDNFHFLFCSLRLLHNLFYLQIRRALLTTYKEGKLPATDLPELFDNSLKEIEVGGKRYSFGLWDTGGRQEQDRLRPNSYPHANVFFLCFSTANLDTFTSIKPKVRFALPPFLCSLHPPLSSSAPSLPFFHNTRTLYFLFCLRVEDKNKRRIFCHQMNFSMFYWLFSCILTDLPPFLPLSSFLFLFVFSSAHIPLLSF